MPKYKYEMHPVTREEYLLWYAEARVSDVKVLLSVLYYTGIRIGEALALRPVDITTTEDGYLRIDAPVEKNKKMIGKRRALDIPLSLPNVKMVFEYAQDRAKAGLLTLFDFSDVTYWKRFKELSPDLSAHRFRHNRSTRLAEQEADPYAIRDWLGHSDLRPASEYIQISGVLARKAARRLQIE